MFEFLKTIILFFEENNIPYMLSGSMAMSVYTGPRYTRDFDFIVNLKQESISPLIAYFKEGYYCDEDAVKEAISNKTMFNIIDHKSNYKADFVILKHEPFRKEEFSRRTRVDFQELEIFLVTAEDLLLSKLIWIQELQSGLQMEDIRQLNRIKNLDRGYINQWISALRLNTFELLNNND